MNNEKFTITVSAGMQIASIEQIDNTVVVLVEGVKTEPEKHIPKEGSFVRFTYKDGVGYFICGKFHDGAVYQKKETAMVDSEGEISQRTSYHIAFPFNKSCVFETITKDEFCKSLNDLGYEYNFDTNEIEPLKWQPKEGDEVYNVIFDARSNKFYVYSFLWSTQCTLSDCMKQSKEKAQQLCDKLNAALNEK